MKNITKLKFCMVFLILTLSLIIATTNAEATTEAHGVALTDGVQSGVTWAAWRGMKITVDDTICVYNITRHTTTTGDQCVLGNYTGVGTMTTLATGSTWTSNKCSFSTPLTLNTTQTYVFGSNNTAGNTDQDYSTDSQPTTDSGYIDWEAGFRGGQSDDSRYYGIVSADFTVGVCPNPDYSFVSSNNVTNPLVYQPVNYALNITYTNTSIAVDNVTFYWNGTAQTTTFTDNGTMVQTNNTYTMPDISGTSATINYWWVVEFNTTNVTAENTSQTIYATQIDDCSTFTVKALNISIRKESDDGLINGNLESYIEYTNIYGIEYNYSFNKTGINYTHICLQRNTTIYADFWNEYEVSSYGNFSYFTYNTTLNQTMDDMYLYVTAGATPVTFTVKDTNDNLLSDIYISVLKFDVGNGTYTTTEILKTDGEGKAIGNIILNSEWYKFILTQSGTVVLESLPIIITSTSKEFRINLDQDYFDRYTYVRDIAHTLTFNNATDNFRFTWNDAAGIMHYACLRVVERTAFGDTEINDTCTLATSGTILVNIPANNATYIATSYLRFDERFVLDVLSEVIGSLHITFGEGGVMVSFLIIGVMIMVGAWNPVVAVFLMCIAFVFTNVLGLMYLGWEYLITLIILGGIVIYKMSK